jgi:hypothetical protein
MGTDHRKFIESHHDFVGVYSANADTTPLYKGGEEQPMSGYEGDFDIEKGGITRCATTAAAVASYFCGDDVFAESSDTNSQSHMSLGMFLTSLRALRTCVCFDS